MSRAVPRFHRNNPNAFGVGTGSVIQISFQGQVESQMTINTFCYFSAVQLPSPTQLSTLLAAFQTAMTPKLLACMSADWSGVQIKGTIITGSPPAPVVSTANLGQVGTRAAGHLPTTVAAVLSKYTGQQGQHGRGRVYIPAIAAADVGQSTITSGTLITALSNLGATMLNVLSDGTNNWSPCVAQRSKIPPRICTGFSYLSSVLVRTLLGTCRRRRIGRGK